MRLFRRRGEVDEREIEDRLIKAMKDRNRNVAAASAAALGQMGGPRALAALYESLTLFRESRNSQGVGPAAAGALGEIGDLAAFECLLDCVGDHTWGPVEEAKRALARLPRAELVARLLKALVGPDPNRGATAAEMLGYLRDPSTLDALTTALGDRAHLEDIAGFRGNKPVEVLIGALGHPNRSVRMDATSRLIGGTGPFDRAERLAARINSETVDRLAYALEVGDRDTRWLAADLLAIRRPPSEAVVSALARSLGFGDGDLVRKCLAALVAIGGPEAAAALKRFAADPPLPDGWNRDSDWQKVRREWQALALHALEKVSADDFAGARSSLGHTPGDPAVPREEGLPPSPPPPDSVRD
jgi:HEAT repeat protein